MDETVQIVRTMEESNSKITVTVKKSFTEKHKNYEKYKVSTLLKKIDDEKAFHNDNGYALILEQNGIILTEQTFINGIRVPNGRK